MLKVGFSASTGFKEGRPLWGSKIIFDDFTGDKTMEGIEQSSIPETAAAQELAQQRRGRDVIERNGSKQP